MQAGLHTASGQNLAHIDSVKANLNAQNFEQSYQIFLAISWEYRKSFPDSTIFYAKKALAISSDPANSLNASKPLNFIGVGFYYRGDNVAAFEYYNQAKDSAILHADSLQYGHSLNNIGRIYFNQGNYIEAYDYFFRSLEIFEALEDYSAMGYGYKSLAELYQSQDNLEKALEMSLKTAEIRENYSNPSGLISIYLEIAGIYAQMSNYSSSLSYFTQAYDIAESGNDRINLAIIKLNISKMNTERGQLQMALSNAKDAIKFLEGSNNLNLINQVDFQLGVIYFYKGNHTLAKDYFKSVKNVSSENNDITLKRDAYFYLSKIYEQETKLELAYANFKNYEATKEKTNNANTARQIERLESRLAIELKEKENEILKLNQEAFREVIRKQKSLNYALIAIASLILLLLIILFITASKRRKRNRLLLLKNSKIEHQQVKITNQNREIKLQNDKLIIRNQELDDLNDEKDAMLNIVAHDMKAPFQRIKGLTELLRLSQLSDDQEQYAQLIRNNAKHGTYLINDLLDVNAIEVNKEKPVVLSIDLKKAVDDIITAHVVELSDKNMNIEVDCEPDQIVNTEKMYLDRILDNLLSNAIKFSAVGSDIMVKAGKKADEFWISIKDFGPGFTDKDQKKLYKKFSKLSAQPTGGESSNGLGLAIVKTLVDRLEGNITLKTETNKYSEFTIYLPNKRVTEQVTS